MIKEYMISMPHIIRTFRMPLDRYFGARAVILPQE